MNKKKCVNAEMINLIIGPIIFQFYEELLNLEYILISLKLNRQ